MAKLCYTRMGCECRIVADHGAHRLKGFDYPVRLVTIKRLDDNAEKFYLANFLRTDGGALALDKAVEAAPKVTLEDKKLKQALEEAR